MRARERRWTPAASWRVDLLRAAAAAARGQDACPEAVPSSVRQTLDTPGRPLDASTRSFMEPRFGQDFSGVRVHTSPRRRGPRATSTRSPTRRAAHRVRRRARTRPNRPRPATARPRARTRRSAAATHPRRPRIRSASRAIATRPPPSAPAPRARGPCAGARSAAVRATRSGCSAMTSAARLAAQQALPPGAGPATLPEPPKGTRGSRGRRRSKRRSRSSRRRSWVRTAGGHAK